MAEPEPMETTTAAETGAPAESPVAAAAEEENMSGDEEDLFGAISDDDAGSADDDAVEAGAGPGADEDSTANNSNSLADVDLAAAAAEADALPDPQGDGDNDDDDGGAAALGLVASDDDAEDDDVVYKTYTEDGPAMEVVLGPVPKVGKEVYSVKMPNFLAVEPEPYTREDYVDPNDARKAEDDDKLVIPCEYYVRWRTNAEGKPESNTRLVEWEDGSWHLFVGSEAFEAQVVRETQYREIGIRQLDSIETLGATVGGRISFRPVDINSKAHKLMTRAVASRSQADGETASASGHQGILHTLHSLAAAHSLSVMVDDSMSDAVTIALYANTLMLDVNVTASGAVASAALTLVANDDMISDDETNAKLTALATAADWSTLSAVLGHFCDLHVRLPDEIGSDAAVAVSAAFAALTADVRALSAASVAAAGLYATITSGIGSVSLTISSKVLKPWPLGASGNAIFSMSSGTPSFIESQTSSLPTKQSLLSECSRM